MLDVVKIINKFKKGALTVVLVVVLVRSLVVLDCFKEKRINLRILFVNFVEVCFFVVFLFLEKKLRISVLLV